MVDKQLRCIVHPCADQRPNAVECPGPRASFVHIVVQKLGLSCDPIETRPKVVYLAP